MKRGMILAAAIAAATLGMGTLAHAQDSTMDQVRDNGVLRVGVTQAPPWYSKDIVSGEWTGGLGVSMGKAMAETLGVTFEPVEVTWGTAVAALQADRIDLMFVLDATDARKEAVNFPETPLLYYCCLPGWSLRCGHAVPSTTDRGPSEIGFRPDRCASAS